jgi:hypothetical protein
MSPVRIAILGSLVLLSSPATAPADKSLAGIACRGVHLGYSTPACEVFVNSVTVEKSAPGTYFCVSATIARRARFGPAWTRRDGVWKAVEEARFTADSNPAVNIDAGQSEHGWFLATGGGTKNEHTELGKRMKTAVTTEPPAHVLVLDELIPDAPR